MFSIIETGRPGRNGRGMYTYEFYAEGERIGGCSVNPMWQTSCADQLEELFSDAIESAGYDLSDNRIFARAWQARYDIKKGGE